MLSACMSDSFTIPRLNTPEWRASVSFVAQWIAPQRLDRRKVEYAAVVEMRTAHDDFP